jgi:hypothetical protein
MSSSLALNYPVTVKVLEGPVLVNEVVDIADTLSGDTPSESSAQSEAGTVIKVKAIAGFILAAVGVAVGAAFIVSMLSCLCYNEEM